MYKHIMVPLDGSELAECVLPHVETLAQGRNAKKITLVRVIEPLHMYGGVESRFSPEERQHLEEDALKVAREYLDKKVKQLADKGVKVQADVLSGHVVDTIINYTTNNNVDIIVLATHGRSGISRWVWGSVTDRLLRSACIPILMVRAPGCAVGI